MEEIERRAEALLGELGEWIWDGSGVPVPVERIAADGFGLLVREIAPEEMLRAPGCPPLEPGQSLSGLLLAADREIWVNAEEAAEWPGRRRFTICHELGHWVLHHTGGDPREALFCRHGSVVEAEPPAGREALPPAEEQANAFAAAVLMPAGLLERHYRALPGEGRFERLCELFDASGKAMGRRLHAVIPGAP